MAEHALNTPTIPPRRSLCALGVAMDVRRRPQVIPNAADAPLLDMEPDADGEAEPDEASAQPFTLAMDRFPPVVHRPSVAQMRRAYRETGAAVPANLRFDIFGRARA
jgi:hypothetical protein